MVEETNDLFNNRQGNRLGIWSGHENFFYNLDTILEQILDNRPSMVDISDLVTLPYPVRVSKILNFLSRD